MADALDRARLDRFLGPVAPWSLGDVVTLGQVQCDGFTRRDVAYDVPSGRAAVSLCIPDDLTRPTALIYCHHQHAHQFLLGKSEVVGLRGDPNLAYAAELARRGFVTVSADAIGFEDRHQHDGRNPGWYELAARLVKGRTLLADELQEISLAIDNGLSLAEVDDARGVGFIGHSFGGHLATWAPAADPRITVSVSNCGCMSYAAEPSLDAAFQADIVVPGFGVSYDVADLIEVAGDCQFLVIAGEADRWSRGAAVLRAEQGTGRLPNLRLHVRPGGHTFPREDRDLAYAFLADALAPSDATACTARPGSESR